MLNKKHIFLIVKLAVSAASLYAVIRGADFHSLQQMVHGINAVYALIANLFLVGNVFIVAFRWKFIAKFLVKDSCPSIRYFILATFSGLFFGQVLPGGVGGDAVRAWLLVRRGISLGLSAASIFVDRFMAIMGVLPMMLTILFSGAYLRSAGRIDTSVLSYAVLAIYVAGASGLTFLFYSPTFLMRVKTRWGRSYKLVDLILMVRATVFSVSGLSALILSVMIQCLTSLAFLMLGKALNVALPMSVTFSVIPLSILISALPISIAGWGVREASIIVGLNFFGVPRDQASILSVALGISLLFSSLPGGLAWLFLSPRSSSDRLGIRRVGEGTIS